MTSANSLKRTASAEEASDQPDRLANFFERRLAQYDWASFCVWKLVGLDCLGANRVPVLMTRAISGFGALVGGLLAGLLGLFLYFASVGERVVFRPPPPAPSEDLPEDIPLTVLFEDAHLLVLDKPAGLVVHPAPGHPSGTLVNALLHHVDDLSGIGGEKRPGIVHRLDRGTSGLMVVAKHDAAHQEQRGEGTGVSRLHLGQRPRRLVRGFLAPAEVELRGALRRAHHVRGVHRLVGGDQHERLGTVRVGRRRQHLRAEHVVAERFAREAFEEALEAGVDPLPPDPEALLPCVRRVRFDPPLRPGELAPIEVEDFLLGTSGTHQCRRLGDVLPHYWALRASEKPTEDA